MRKKILIVDDQPEMRKSVQRILRLAGYDCEEAGNGEEALALIKQAAPNLILSDLRMPKMDGIELLHSVRSQLSIPFVLMTGFAEIIESAEAYQIGVDGFLLKPFRQEDLLSSIEEAFLLRQQKVRGPGQTFSDNFCGVAVKEFIAGREIRFPIYLRLSQQKFVRIAYTGEDLSNEKIKDLEKRGVLSLYLEREDFRKYISFASKMSEVVFQNESADAAKKAEFLRRSSEAILGFGFHQFVDEHLLEQAKGNVDQSLSLLTDEPELMKLLDSLTAHSSVLHAHAMGVALVASLCAKELEWEAAALRFRIVAGAMFHDLGKMDLPEGIRERGPESLAPAELELWHGHPAAGASRLRLVPGLPAEIAQIVLHHHELGDGSGFPAGLTQVRIHPVAKLISAADEFFHLYRGGEGYGKGLNPTAVLSEMRQRNGATIGGRVKWEYLGALEKVFAR